MSTLLDAARQCIIPLRYKCIREGTGIAEKDVVERILEDYNDVFADIANMFLFGGHRRIAPNELEDIQALSMYKFAGKLHSQERDVCKVWRRGGVAISMLGLENQTGIDNDMPLRVIGYDGAAYRAQVGRPGERYPVITIVLYFGDSRWTGPRTLLERLNVTDGALRPLISDYKINVCEVAWLEDAQLRMLESDFRLIAECSVQRRQRRDYEPSEDREIVHAGETLELLSLVTGDENFSNMRYSINEGEKISMYNIFAKRDAEAEARGIAVGEARGEARGIAMGEARARRSIMETLISRGMAPKEAAALAGVSV